MSNLKVMRGRIHIPPEVADRFILETGIPASEQEANWMNGTLQMVDSTSPKNDEGFAFTIHTYVDVPPVMSEEMLASYLTERLGRLAALDKSVIFQVRTGRND